tara:strand:- start:13984 stop:14742 length:759 start_codon:yes stop_codon:yes gene_type:complete
MIDYVIYSHTDYLEVLNIQTDHLPKDGNNILFLNYNDLHLEDLYYKYDKVIFYDDSKPYASRLSMAIKQLDCEYFLFMHDIDILLNHDVNVLRNIKSLMLKNSIDRVDLKHTNNMEDCNTLDFGLKDHLLVKQTDPTNYIYNVNPSIWKKESFMKLLTNFPNKSYRDIEYFDVQNFCLSFDVYKVYSDQYKLCGYFNCLDFFTFLHISHGGKLLPLTSKFETVYGQSYSDVSKYYSDIVERYDLKRSKKWIQ